MQSLHRALDLAGGRRRPGRAPDHRRDRRRQPGSRSPRPPVAAHPRPPAATCANCRTAATRSGSGWSPSAARRARCSAPEPRRVLARLVDALGRDREPRDPVRLPRASTSPRRRPGTPCGCSPRSAGRSACTAPGWARRSSPVSSEVRVQRHRPPGRAAGAGPSTRQATEAALLADLADVRGPRRRPRRAGAGGRRPLRRGVAVGPEPMSAMAVSVSGPVTRMTDDVPPAPCRSCTGPAAADQPDAQRRLTRGEPEAPRHAVSCAPSNRAPRPQRRCTCRADAPQHVGAGAGVGLPERGRGPGCGTELVGGGVPPMEKIVMTSFSLVHFQSPESTFSTLVQPIFLAMVSWEMLADEPDEPDDEPSPHPAVSDSTAMMAAHPAIFMPGTVRRIARDCLGKWPGSGHRGHPPRAARSRGSRRTRSGRSPP